MLGTQIPSAVWMAMDSPWWKAASSEPGGAPEAGPAPGFLPPGLSPEPVWQCRAALALGIGPSPCQEWGWLRSRRRSGAHGTLQGLPCPLPVPGARPHLTIPLIQGGHHGRSIHTSSRMAPHQNHWWKEPFFSPLQLINGSAVLHFFPGILSLSACG